MSSDIRTINLGFVNAYLVKLKHGFVLIDAGISQQWQALEKELIASGCLPDKLKLVIITHGDRDHTGSCARLQKQYKARIAMHKADSLMAEKAIYTERKARTLRAKLMILMARVMSARMPFEKFKPDIYLKDGENLAKYGFEARVVHIPGHTKGSIGILTSDADFFCGDALINTRKPETAIFIENYDELSKSLDKIRKLKIRNFYPGHGRPFSMELFLKSFKN